MNTQKIKQVFEEEIRPKLGKVHSKEKYLEIVTELYDSRKLNDGKGMRESELQENARPGGYALSRLAEIGIVQITLPVGDGTLLVDPVNNKRELFHKREMIEDYHQRFQKHVNSNSQVRQIVMTSRNIDSQKELQKWLNNLDNDENFVQYNEVVFKLLEKGVDIKTEGYGPLTWRKMAKYYNLDKHIQQMIGE